MGVEGLSKAHLIWQMAQTKSVVWVVPDLDTAEEVLMDLHYFAQERRAHKFSNCLLKNERPITPLRPIQPS